MIKKGYFCALLLCLFALMPISSRAEGLDSRPAEHGRGIYLDEIGFGSAAMPGAT